MSITYEIHSVVQRFPRWRYRAYQPLTTYWAEADQIVHSEFRDGNVPAGHQQLRVLTDWSTCLLVWRA